MNRAFKRQTAPFHMKRDHILAIDGSKHPFTVGNAKERKAAIESAQDAGQARLDTMVKQKGSALSKSELRSGQFDQAPPEPAAPRSLKPPPPDGPTNEYSTVVQSLESQTPRTAVERGQHQRRIALFRQKEAERNAEILAEQAATAHATSEDVVGLRNTLDSLVAEAERDGKSTPARIAELKRLKQLADSPGVEPYSVWSQARALGVIKPTGASAARDVGISQPIEKLRDADRNTTGQDGTNV